MGTSPIAHKNSTVHQGHTCQPSLYCHQINPTIPFSVSYTFSLQFPVPTSLSPLCKISQSGKHRKILWIFIYISWLSPGSEQLRFSTTGYRLSLPTGFAKISHRLYMKLHTENCLATHSFTRCSVWPHRYCCQCVHMYMMSQLQSILMNNGAHGKTKALRTPTPRWALDLLKICLA